MSQEHEDLHQSEINCATFFCLRSGVDKVFVLQVCGFSLLLFPLLTFRDKVMVSPLRVTCPRNMKKFLLAISILTNENTDNKLNNYLKNTRILNNVFRPQNALTKTRIK
jgi:hypothetical protein